MCQDDANAPDVTLMRDTTSSASPSFFNGCTEGRRFHYAGGDWQGVVRELVPLSTTLTVKVAIKRIQNVVA
jgi:hypothetical protein